MTAADLALYSAIAVAGVLLSALFSGMETGLYTINRVRLMIRAGNGEPSAVRLRGQLMRPNRTLSTLLLGNNMANYAGSFGVAALLDSAGFSPIGAVAINAAVLVPLLFVFGETLPKDLFRTHTDRWSYSCVGALEWTGRILTWTGLVPLVEGFSRLVGRLLRTKASARTTSRQRISQLIKEGIGAGVISETQTSLADRALAMRTLTVRDEMVPWRQVVTLGAQADHAARQAVMRRRDFTRLPVVDADGTPVGVLSLLDAVLDPDRPTTDLLIEPLTFDPSTPARVAMRRMQHARQAMAIVADPLTRRPLGIVTMKDLVEPLTGELQAW